MNHQERIEVERATLQRRYNQRVYITYEVKEIFKRVGYAGHDSRVDSLLKEYQARTSASEPTLNAGKKPRAIFYLSEKIWEILQKLQTEGEINLEIRNIRSLDDVLPQKNSTTVTKERRTIIPGWQSSRLSPISPKFSSAQ